MAEGRHPKGPGGSQGSGPGQQSKGRDPNQDRELKSGRTSAINRQRGSGAQSGRRGSGSKPKPESER